MSLTIDYTISDKYLRVIIQGSYSPMNAVDAIEGMKIEADKHNMKHILVDGLGLAKPDNNLIRTFTGDKISELLGSYKLASYSQHYKINNVAEKFAVNRGSKFRVCETEDEAIKWLVG